MNGRAQRFRYLFVGGLGALLLALGGGFVWFVHGFMNSKPPPTKRVVQEIQVIRPPPPPPEQPPPPPPPEEEKLVENEPPPEAEPTPSNEPPPSEQLGVDAEGGAGGDAFGLVGRKGGRDLLASGGSALAWYGGLVKSEILEWLQNVPEARKGSYSVAVRIWLRDDGSIERIRLAQSTGDARRDQAIEAELGRHGRFSQAPPADTPQPVVLRIVSRA